MYAFDLYSFTSLYFALLIWTKTFDEDSDMRIVFTESTVGLSLMDTGFRVNEKVE